jgi:hypothetical protein
MSNVRAQMSELAGLANNTKWSELQSLMSSLGSQAPYWRTQATNGFVYPTSGWDGDWTYHFRLGEYKQIEWREMTPRGGDGCLSVEAIASALKKIGFEFEVKPNVVRIVGYRRL